MKRLLIAGMAAVMVLAAAGCAKEESAIAQLNAQGFYPGMASADEQGFHAFYMNPDKPETIYRVDAPLTDEEYDQYVELMMEGDEKLQEFLAALKGSTKTDVSDLIPTQEELDAFSGMTVGELEAEGFENSGWSVDGSEMILYYDGEEYEALVYVNAEDLELYAGDIIDEQWDAIREAEIDHVEFGTLSYRLFEE